MSRILLGGAAGGLAALAAVKCLRRPAADAPADPKDLSAFRLLGEGGRHSVFVYAGKEERWRRRVLRFHREECCELKKEVAFAKDAMVALFGENCMPPMELVRCDAAGVAELSKQSKRGGINGPLAILSDNVASNPGFGGQCVTVEIKPKCGLVEEEQMPSRYQLLQQKKLQRGEIARVSHYDPVDLFASCRAQVERAIRALEENPQNNFRLFMDGEVVALEPGALASDSFAREVLDSRLAGVVQRHPVFRRILAAQCWAAGRNGENAHALLRELERCGLELTLDPADVKKVIATNSADESAMRQFERDGARLVEQSKRHFRTSGQSSKEMERNMLAYLRRFLLGRTAMDCSVLITFLKLEREPSKEEKRALADARFERSVESDSWVRVSVVDVALKPAERIPLYHRQWDELRQLVMDRVPRGRGT